MALTQSAGLNFQWQETAAPFFLKYAHNLDYFHLSVDVQETPLKIEKKISRHYMYPTVLNTDREEISLITNLQIRLASVHFVNKINYHIFEAYSRSVDVWQVKRRRTSHTFS